MGAASPKLQWYVLEVNVSVGSDGACVTLPFRNEGTQVASKATDTDRQQSIWTLVWLEATIKRTEL